MGRQLDMGAVPYSFDHSSTRLGVVTLARGLRRAVGRQEARALFRHPIALTTGLVGAIGWFWPYSMASRPLYGRRISLVGRNRLTKAAMLYSVNSITTRGASGLKLEPEWQMMGALEAADGMLLFGISTAFVFVVIQQIEQVISQVQD